MSNSFERAGDAMLQAQEGNRLIAQAIGRALYRFFRRLGHGAAAMLSAMPGSRLHP